MATVWRKTRGELVHIAPGVEASLTRELFGLNVEVCSICGRRRATAWWRGQTILSICRPCALDVLPKLLADALVGEGPSNESQLHADAANVLRTFWTAAKLALKRVAAVAARAMPSGRKWPPNASVN